MRYRTGRAADGRQVIVGPSCPDIIIYFFDIEGKFIEKKMVGMVPPLKRDEVRGGYIFEGPQYATMEKQIRSIQESLGCVPQTIQIQDFCDKETGIATADLPHDYEKYLADPGSYSFDDGEDQEDIEQAIQEWKEKQRFVFYWGNELWVSRDGEVIST